MDRAKDALGLRHGEEIESQHEIFGDPELIRLGLNPGASPRNPGSSLFSTGQMI